MDINSISKNGLKVYTFFLDEKEAQGDVALRPAPGNSAAEQRLESVLLMAGPAHVEKISI